MFIGYLEYLPSLHRSKGDDGKMVLRAFVAQDAGDLELSLWDRAIEAREGLASLKP